MARHATLALLALASSAMILALVVPHPASGVVFASASLLFPPALAALGALRRGRLGSLVLPLLALGALLQALLAALLLLSGRPWTGTLWLGLPPAGALLVYGLGLAPLVLVSLLFAWHAPRFGPSEEQLRRLRRLSARRGETPDGESGT
jgi:hypothetical protein